MPADRRRRLVGIGAGLTAGLLLAACSGYADPDPDAVVVEVFGNAVGPSGERLGAALEQASAGQPVQLRYVGVTSFVEQLEDRLGRGDPPAIALLPQPGVLVELLERGLVADLSDDLVAQLRRSYPPALLELVDIDGRPRAVWLTVDVKGLVWYRPAQFRDRGLVPPSSLDDLAVRSEQVRTAPDGTAPWCLAMEAGASTGWVGTDWVEAYVLRRLGPDAYDRWALGELPFDSPEVEAVFDELDGLLRAPGAVPGGPRTVLSTPWTRVAEQLLEDPAPCLMTQQADVLRSELPDTTVIGPDGDVDFFPLPAAAAAERAPLVLGGRLAAPLDDAPEVAQALALLAGEDMAAALVETAGMLSPHVAVTSSATADATTARLLALINEAAVVRFDASDLMDPAVGTGTFWTGMKAFFGGESADTVLPDIQAGWPAAPGS